MKANRLEERIDKSKGPILLEVSVRAGARIARALAPKLAGILRDYPANPAH